MNLPRLRFQARALTSLLLAVGFIALLVSGGVLFLSPPGRVANWTQWQILGLTKHGWGDLHITFGAVFLVAGLIHVAFNLRPILQHLGARMASRGSLRLEWVAALFIGLGVFVGTRAQVPPFSTLLAWSEQLRGGWEENLERAPVAHAELLTVGELASQAGVSAEEALRRLELAGVKDSAVGKTAQAVADATGITPAEVYQVIRGSGSGTGVGVGSDHPAQSPGAGGGPGRKTLAEYCAGEGLGLEEALARLGRRGIQASGTQTLRDIAVAHGFERPVELLQILQQK